MAKATLHPTQIQILEATARRGRLSPVQFCAEGAEIQGAAYHFRALHKVGLLEAAGTAKRRGATEHFYRLSPSAGGE